jgi:predicted DCC family thiol-disulfide oxidoreductase YuxK
MAEPAHNPLPLPQQPMLVYDGSCGFCSRAVQFILRHERRHNLLFVPRESALGRDIRLRFGLEAVESMLWVENGQAAIESEAVVRSAKYIGGGWAAFATLGSLCPMPVRNWGYRLIARNRRRLSSGSAICLLPTPEQRARFLNN